MMQLPAMIRCAGAGQGSPATFRLGTLRRWIAARAFALAASRPRSYLLVTVLCAAAGYGYLLLFPWLVYSGVSAVYDALQATPAVAWNRVLAGSLVAVPAALVSYRLARFRPARPGGFTLEPATAPKVWQLVAELGAHYRRIRIDRIVLTGSFGIDIRKTPHGCLPVGSSSTLAIGLPLLQCLSALQFRVALARRLGQYTGRYNRLENWLYGLRTVWPRYGTHSAQSGFGYQPIGWFFAAYTPVYRALTLPVAHREELAADRYAMEIFTDEQVLETVTTEMVCRTYLAQRYWPLVREIEAREGQALPGSHPGMARVLRAGLRDNRAGEWLERTRCAVPDWHDPVPALMTRVRHIGHNEPRMTGLAADPAAATYLATVMAASAGAPGIGDTDTAARQEQPLPAGHPLVWLAHRARCFLDRWHTARPLSH
jgi:hypothetical protein